jgi:hypothetical protein
VEIQLSDRLSLKERLQALRDAQRELARVVREDAAAGLPAMTLEQPPLALMEPETLAVHPWFGRDSEWKRAAAHARVITGIEAIWFEDGQDHRETMAFPALVAASIPTLLRVAQVNAARAAFKTLLLDIKQRYAKQALAEADEDGEADSETATPSWRQRDKVMQEALKSAGMARLCVKQAYRPIQVIEERGLLRAQYYRKLKVPMRKTTAAAERARVGSLRDSGSGVMEEAYERLCALADNTPLVEVRNPNRIVTVNAKLEERGWCQRTGVLPIFYHSEPSDPAPAVDMSRLVLPHQKETHRSDRTLEALPLIPALHLYRYAS